MFVIMWKCSKIIQADIVYSMFSWKKKLICMSIRWIVSSKNKDSFPPQINLQLSQFYLACVATLKSILTQAAKGAIKINTFAQALPRHWSTSISQLLFRNKQRTHFIINVSLMQLAAKSKIKFRKYESLNLSAKNQHIA